MGSTRIAARPASTMKSEMTTAKIGRSMKKRENMMLLGAVSWIGAIVGADDQVAAQLLEHYFFGGGPPFASPFGGAPGGGAFGSPTCTGAPGKKIFARPSTITLSPGARPDVMIQSLPVHSPTVTGRGIALLSGDMR